MYRKGGEKYYIQYAPMKGKDSGITLIFPNKHVRSIKDDYHAGPAKKVSFTRRQALFLLTELKEYLNQ